jgi:hypothetical protein
MRLYRMYPMLQRFAPEIMKKKRLHPSPLSRHIHIYTSTSTSTLGFKRGYINILALKGELGLAVHSHSTPSRLIGDLAVVTNGSRLPGLVKSLEEESVETPVEQGAETVLVEMLGVFEATLGFVIVGADGGGPASFSVPGWWC